MALLLHACFHRTPGRSHPEARAEYRVVYSPFVWGAAALPLSTFPPYGGGQFELQPEGSAPRWREGCRLRPGLRTPVRLVAYNNNVFSLNLFPKPDFRRVVLRTGVPEFLKVQCSIFPTFCSAHRSPRNPESPFFGISNGLFSAQESQNS